MFSQVSVSFCSGGSHVAISLVCIGIISISQVDKMDELKPAFTVTVFCRPFFSPFKNWLIAFFWCCSHMMLKNVKKDQKLSFIKTG